MLCVCYFFLNCNIFLCVDIDEDLEILINTLLLNINKQRKEKKRVFSSMDRISKKADDQKSTFKLLARDVTFFSFLLFGGVGTIVAH